MLTGEKEESGGGSSDVKNHLEWKWREVPSEEGLQWGNESSPQMKWGIKVAL